MELNFEVITVTSYKLQTQVGTDKYSRPPT